MGTLICRKIISVELLILLGVTLCSATRSFSHPSASFEDSTGGYGGFPGSFEGSAGGYGGYPSGFAGYGGFPGGYGSGYGGIKDQIPNNKDEVPSTTPTKTKNIGTKNGLNDKDKIGVGHDTTVGGPDEDHQGDENSGYDGYGGGYGDGYGYGCYCSYPGCYGGYPWYGYGHGSTKEKVTSTNVKKNGAIP